MKPDTPAWRWPLLLSLGAHGVLAVVLWGPAWHDEEETPWSGDTIVEDGPHLSVCSSDAEAPPHPEAPDGPGFESRVVDVPVDLVPPGWEPVAHTPPSSRPEEGGG